jgi:hypothetical protein
MTELECVEDEARLARGRLIRGGYELVFAASATYVALFVVGGAIVPVILVFAAFVATLAGIVDAIEGGTRFVLAKREARQLKRLPTARVHRLPR